MNATVVLIATVISLSGGQVYLEEPLGDLLRSGDTGTVYYDLQVSDEVKIVEVGLAEVVESTAQRTLLDIEDAAKVKPGHRVRFEIPLARLSPSDLVRLVERSAEDAAPVDEISEQVEDRVPEAGVQEVEVPEAEIPEPGVQEAEVREAASNQSAEIASPVLALVEIWRTAWQRQDVASYLECYSRLFQPGDGSTREAWVETRTQRLEAPEFIEVELDDIQLDLIHESEVVVRFAQTFRSDRYSDSVTKELTLAQEVAGWRILRERSLP